jgi:hypothetical protein
MNLGYIWRASLTQRLLGMSGVIMLVAGYAMILDHTDADFDILIHRAVDGMVLIIAGGVVEAVVLLVWANR